MLSEISYRGFRNLVDGTWRPGAGSHLLIGPNGAGKTSLLEAVYVLATSKSFRTARLADCRRHEAEELRLRGRLEGGERAEIELAWSAGGLERRINGRLAQLAEYLSALPVVEWSAVAGRLIDGVPEHRRRFLDQGVVGVRPAALAELASYRRALEQKRELLRTGSGGLGAWNEVLAASAGRLIERRRAYADELEHAFSELAAESGLDLPALELRYESSPAGAPERILDNLSSLAAREREAGRPLAGPHRDELRLLWGGHEVRRVGSAGERKAFGLLLTAARARVLAAHGRPPLLLLDDLDAELDESRLDRLWAVLRRGAQVFASSTREGLQRRLGGVVGWRLGGGALRGVESPSDKHLNS